MQEALKRPYLAYTRFPLPERTQELFAAADEKKTREGRREGGREGDFWIVVRAIKVGMRGREQGRERGREKGKSDVAHALLSGRNSWKGKEEAVCHSAEPFQVGRLR